MNVLFIVPGSGDSFYCGNCFRDNLQANALRKAGHQVTVMPLYLPLKDASFRGDTPLFFPAISLFVVRKYFKNKAMPQWMERLLNSDWSLKMAASMSGTTSSAGLEDMTLSMIQGEDRIFMKYMGLIIDWIKNHERPDLIHLSSSLVIGIAKVIKKEINIPIVCSLQDEEIWIDPLGEYAGEAWKGIWDNIGYVDCFVASSEYYKQSVFQRTQRIKQIEVVYPGLNTAKYASDNYPADPVIGFFYRMNRLNGLHILAEAFVKMKKENKIPRLRLKVGGGYSDEDKPFLKEVRALLSPYSQYVDWSDNYTLSGHADFYRQTTVVSVPVTFDEAVGLYVCEAFAAGRPVVEPSTGSFPETVSDGGVLYGENTADNLAEGLTKILSNRELLEECRKNALRLAQERYSDVTMAENLLKVYLLSASSVCFLCKSY
ncbi:MAG: glycosyltransferase family 4 protein [Tannerella sp.]|jgi:glycosyltransferase involved in cell wall biosynthesis|nr:glycosyltransferase family 4 protein [Tannerella sp.]